MKKRAEKYSKVKGPKSVDVLAGLMNMASGMSWTELDYLSELLFIFGNF